MSSVYHDGITYQLSIEQVKQESKISCNAKKCEK